MDLDPDIIEKYVRDLAAKLERERVEVRDRFWKDEVIPIDGYRFVNCRFERCVLVFQWPDFEFLDCAFPETNILPKRTYEMGLSETPSAG